ncbi:probable 2-oxoglutarate-dependent dioxygenase AOP1.2 [Rosa rugosa]|uniref:probable 2-oxoglutarate-dependent dioxygenase AOP1.2 n=1 Tax=Rosa rugosa TaxID=74645 RepID=UPI002B407164|nr:probable 2-oxoglutarate-dependent dioxygenase AOP1.2 [Rosa rugosa]
MAIRSSYRENSVVGIIWYVRPRWIMGNRSAHRRVSFAGTAETSLTSFRVQMMVRRKSCKAWSNGRMHSVKHRVMMCGEKERYSLGAFGVPVEGTIIKAPKELVDEEHPQIFKDFDYMDFSMFGLSAEAMAIDSAMQISAFAGISS